MIAAKAETGTFEVVTENGPMIPCGWEAFWERFFPGILVSPRGEPGGGKDPFGQRPCRGLGVEDVRR